MLHSQYGEYSQHLLSTVVSNFCSSVVLKSSSLGVSSHYLNNSLTALCLSCRENVQLTLTVQLTLGIMKVSLPAFTCTTTFNLGITVKDSLYYLLDTEHIYCRLFIFVNGQRNYEIREERFYSSKSELLQFLS